jgi:hypothetical protein
MPVTGACFERLYTWAAARHLHDGLKRIATLGINLKFVPDEVSVDHATPTLLDISITRA